MKIQILKFFCKSKLFEDKIHPIIFKNSPINDEKEDVFDFSTQVAIIDEAIKNDSTLIGIIGDYGSGKSTLTELCDVKLCKKYGKAIRINLWDTFNENNEKNTLQAGDINIFIRSFLYQLAQANKKSNTNFARYINERQSKNFGKLTLTMASKWALLPFALAGLFFTLFLTTTNDPIFFTFSNFLKETGIVSGITFLNSIKAMSYFILFIGIIFIYIGIKIGAFVFSLWDSQGKILPEAGDIFENYERIVNHMIKRRTKKQIIYIEDLDRINAKNLIIPCLKELYRFANILPPLQKKKIVFIVSLKSESSLQEDDIHDDDKNANSTNTIYSKIFDYTLWIKPFHYENVSDIAFDILTTKNADISKLTSKDSARELLPDLKWVLISENLTIREIKDRLNAVFTLYQTLKTRDLKSSSVNIKKCCATVYLQRAYSSDYEKLLKHEKKLAELIRKCYLYQGRDISSIEEIIGETFGESENYSEKFQKALSNMIFDGDIDEDFMMYFYNYPKNSYIKSIDEKDIVDYILLPSEKYKEDINLSEKIDRVIKRNEGKVIANSIDNLINNGSYCPNIIFDYNQLFCFVIRYNKEIVLDTLKELSNSILKNTMDVSSTLGKILFFDLEKKIKNEIVNNIIKIIHDKLFDKADDDIIKVRLQLIEYTRDYIYLFHDIFVSNKIPIITPLEIEAIKANKTKLDLINTNLIDENNYKGIFTKINSLNLNDEEYNIAENVYLNASNMEDMEDFPEIKILLLDFLSKNKHYNSQLISFILETDFSEIEKERLCLYLQKVDLTQFAIEELTDIDNLKLTKLTNEDVISFFEKSGLLKSALLSRSALNKIEDFDFTQDNIIKKIIDIATEFNTDYPDYFLSIRLAAIKQIKTSDPTFYQLFIDDYPLIRDIELEYIYNSDDDIYLYINYSKINDKNYILLPNYCNKMRFERDSLFKFLTNLLDNLLEFDEDASIIKLILSAIDFKNIHFESMTYEQQTGLSETFENIYDLTSAVDCVEFMQTINCLVPELEEIVWTGAENNEIEYSEYLDLLNDIQKPTNTTLNIMKNIPINQSLSPPITDWLYKNNYFVRYLIGKSIHDNDIPKDPSIHILNYYNALIHSNKFAELCFKRKEILLEFARNKVLDKKLVDSYLLNFYTIRQPIFLISFILYRLNDDIEEVKRYLYSIVDIDTEREANEFIDIITNEKYIKLLRDKDLFYWIYHRMWNKSQKHSLTFKVNKKLGTKYNAKEAGDYVDV
jgi:hypothetical protein